MNYDGGFIIGIRRRKIEDQIIEKFRKVNFKQAECAWLEDAAFWDYVFSWHDLSRYYEQTRDTALGSAVLDLYAYCVPLVQSAAQNCNLHERRRERAQSALVQMSYFLNQIMVEIDRNTHAEDDNPAGQIRW